MTAMKDGLHWLSLARCQAMQQLAVRQSHLITAHRVYCALLLEHFLCRPFVTDVFSCLGKVEGRQEIDHGLCPLSFFGRCLVASALLRVCVRRLKLYML